MLDTVSKQDTAEGAELELHPAGAPVRALAWTIDAALRLLFLAILIPVFSIGKTGAGLFWLLFFLIEWFYYVPFEVLRGATPGKRIMGLRVVTDDGTQLTWSASLVRNLLRVVDFFPVLYGMGLVWCLFHRQSKRLGDLAAGTLVVYAQPSGLPRLPASLSQNPVEAPALALDYRAQQALMGFAERAEQLSPARREELADLLGELHGSRGMTGLQHLYGYARWVAGQR